MSFELATQQAIFNALDGNVSAQVFDYVDVLPSGQPDASFPYVVIGDDTFTAWDTDDRLGAEMTITLHVWSKSKGNKQVKTIAGEIYDILHRADLQIVGYHTVDCLCEFTEFMRESDGITRHGVLRYRITVQDWP